MVDVTCNQALFLSFPHTKKEREEGERGRGKERGGEGKERGGEGERGEGKERGGKERGSLIQMLPRWPSSPSHMSFSRHSILLSHSILPEFTSHLLCHCFSNNQKKVQFGKHLYQFPLALLSCFTVASSWLYCILKWCMLT